MKIFEIGVGQIWQCRTKEYINTEHECHLFEPNPENFAKIHDYFKDYNNFKLFPYAIGRENKKGNLILLEGSSYLDGNISPAYTADKEKYSITNNPAVEIEIKNIKEFDDGKIDILLLDVEGSEFEVIDELISRPKTIIVEMYSFGSKYKNPNFDKIIKWMKENGYKTIHEHEDFVFEKER
jgi:hypothetical protein